MREPNIKELIESLASEDIVESVFSDGRNAEAEISQVLYFMQREQTVTLYNEISGLEPNRKKRVFASLVNLYPLSRHIIMQLLIKREGAPLDFLAAYDVNSALLKQVRETLKEVKSNSNASSITFNTYQRDIEAENEKIESLRADLARLNDVSNELKSKRAQREELERQLAVIQGENVESLDKEIEELGMQIREQRERKENKSREREKLASELGTLADELKKEESANMGNYQKALSALEKCIKAIPEKG